MSSSDIVAIIATVVAIVCVVTDALGFWDRLDGIKRHRR